MLEIVRASETLRPCLASARPGDINHIGFWGSNGYWGHAGVWGPNGGHWGHSTGIGPDGIFGPMTGIVSGDKYDERKEALPAKFHAKSDLTIEIPAPENKHDLNLTGN